MGAVPDGFDATVTEYTAWMAAAGYAATTVRSRRRELGCFATWCAGRGHIHPGTLAVGDIERYRLLVHARRKADGRPLGCGAQVQKLLAVKQLLRWTTRMGITATDAGAAVALPKRPQKLPRAVLGVVEVERVLGLPNVGGPVGLRDRAILETFYSTGIRRLELIRLAVGDLDAARGVLMVREGKGGKDRVVPIGERALHWVGRYLQVRQQSVRGVDPGNLFLTQRGRPLRPNRLTELVHRYVERARLAKHGSCHLFRHTMATLMLEHGADVRYLQEMLGHAKLTTTELYTRVSITQLKAVHARTHPAYRLRGSPEVVTRNPREALNASCAPTVAGAYW